MISTHGLDVGLNELPFLRDIEDSVRNRLEMHAAETAFEGNAYIFQEGDQARAFYLLRRGEVALEVRVPGKTPFIVETLFEGDVLGWSWLMPAQRWGFSARAAQPVQAVTVDAAGVLAEMQADPAFANEIYRRFLPVMGERLSAARYRMIDMYAQPKSGGFVG